MATDFLYPFQNTAELKTVFSEIYVSTDFDSLKSSFVLAADEIKDVISDAMWDKMLLHYNSGDYGKTDTEEQIRLNKLVDLTRIPFANFAIFHHFIWLTINVKDNSVTVVKSDSETTAYKYQTDEAKQKLLQTAWLGINNLIDFLDTEKANFSDWTDSDQYKELQEIIFDDHKDFNKNYGIDKSALFYIKVRSIILLIQEEEILPRIEGKISEIEDSILKIKIKRAVAFRTMARACLQLDYFNLPGSIRRSIDNEMTKKNTAKQSEFVQQKLSEVLDNQADSYMRGIDLYLASKKEVTAPESQYDDFDHTPESTDKHYFPGI